MAVNRGKQWEQKVEEYWGKSFPYPKSSLIRLPDQVTGYKTTSQNPCDFVGYIYPKAFYIECKSTHGNTFSLDFSQYERLLKYKGIKGLHPGIMLWFVDHDKVGWIDIKDLEKMKLDGKKSVNVKMFDTDEYNIVHIPGIKKRVFIECDFTVLTELED